ncbi:DUF5596 domain-containing protein [Bifidobacterium sp. LC6]|uniref:DUF5596 domain-containing protein n=1 Tax=Bifidobacterium colobi TaxID=2809026 RepID=A0ABS5UXL7_9BIFI|nr:DUF5596 domain-containing protein [Bifidobacterium colobi]
MRIVLRYLMCERELLRKARQNAAMDTAEMNTFDDYAPYSRYYGMERDMVGPAAELLRWMRQDVTCVAMLERICSLTVADRNVPAAVAVHERLRAYVTTFYPMQPEGNDLALAAVMMHCLPAAVSQLESLGVPNNVIEATLRDFAIWARVHQERTGRPGIDETAWNLLSLTGNILRIGRLQYELTTFLEPYYVYRCSNDGRIVIFAAPDLQVRLDGHWQGANGWHTKTGFVTALKADESTLVGNPVDTDRGIIQAEPITIRRDEYDLVLAPGMPVTSVHIPEDGPLSPDAVDASFAKATQLLARLHRQAMPWFCESWLLDPSLERLSSPESNLCNFMRRFVKFPVASARPMMIERVFGWGANDCQTAALPERTSLQRNLKRFLLAGNAVYDVGGLML